MSQVRFHAMPEEIKTSLSALAEMRAGIIAIENERDIEKLKPFTIALLQSFFSQRTMLMKVMYDQLPQRSEKMVTTSSSP